MLHDKKHKIFTNFTINHLKCLAKRNLLRSIDIETI